MIPESLQKKAVDTGHQGTCETKFLLREKVWFSGIDELTKTTLESCLECQKVGKAGSPEAVWFSGIDELVKTTLESRLACETVGKAESPEAIWFLGIDELVKPTLESCLACQAVRKAASPESVRLSSMPKAPWDLLHVDFF